MSPQAAVLVLLLALVAGGLIGAAHAGRTIRRDNKRRAERTFGAAGRALARP
jgi:hypothetical protein